MLVQDPELGTENPLMREFYCLKALGETAGIPRVYYYAAPAHYSHRMLVLELLGRSLETLAPMSGSQMCPVARQLVGRDSPCPFGRSRRWRLSMAPASCTAT